MSIKRVYEEGSLVIILCVTGKRPYLELVLVVVRPHLFSILSDYKVNILYKI